MAFIVYATREDVKTALPVLNVARLDYQVDQALQSATDTIDGETHRTFRPRFDTRYFDWPNVNSGRYWRLWLDANEVVSLTQLTAGGVVISSADYFLEPEDFGPPYDRIEIDLASSAAFSVGATHQRAIAAQGIFGHDFNTERVGTLTSELSNDPDDTASATWTTPRIGVGDVLYIDNELMVVRDKTFVDSGQNSSALTASNADVTITGVTAGTIAPGTLLLIDSERMWVVDVAGTTLTVKRAWDGSVLAAHSNGADIYTQSGVDLDRAQLGSTIATHPTSTAIHRHIVPSLIRDYGKALAINQVLQETAGYGRTVGSGDSEREAAGKGLSKLCQQVYTRYGRKMRHRAV